MCLHVRYFLLPSLTILFLLSQDGNFFSSWEIQEKQHSLFSDDISKVHIVHLQVQNKRQKKCFYSPAEKQVDHYTKQFISI